jgi:hypothetical protein
MMVKYIATKNLMVWKNGKIFKDMKAYIKYLI